MLFSTHLHHLRFSLISTFFPDISDEEKQTMHRRWFPDAAKQQQTKQAEKFSASYLAGVLGKLEHEEDGNEFVRLKEAIDEHQRTEFVLSRVGHARAKAARLTPRHIKNLKPPTHGCVLTWQPTCFSFQGYFPIPETERKEAADKAKAVPKKRATRKIQTHWSRSRSYKEKRTKLEALTWVVKWLWKKHQESGGETSIQIQYCMCGNLCICLFSFFETGSL